MQERKNDHLLAENIGNFVYKRDIADKPDKLVKFLQLEKEIMTYTLSFWKWTQSWKKMSLARHNSKTQGVEISKFQFKFFLVYLY